MEQIARLTSNEREAILRQVLRLYNIPESAFSIGASAEQRVCLEKHGGRYHIYIMERGVVFEESHHTTETSAHFEMLNQLAESKDEYRQMCHKYKLLVNMKLNRQMGESTKKMVNSYKKPALIVHVGDVVRIDLKPSMSGQRKEVEGVVIQRRPERSGGTIIIRTDIQGINDRKYITLRPSQIETIEVVDSAKSRRQKSRQVKTNLKKAGRIKGKIKR